MSSGLLNQRRGIVTLRNYQQLLGSNPTGGTNISNFLGINKMQECQATNCQAKATSTISINKPIFLTFKLLNEGNKINVCNRHAKTIKEELEYFA